ncbi:hypothetical protein F4703DRAFT_1332889 [Phycomyces blakesleeanus]
MSAPLPYEILSYIAKCIDRNTQLTCALVCRHWTEPFLNAYWNFPLINGTALKSLCKKTNRNNVHLRNLHRTRGLNIYDLTEKDMKNFPKLQQIYQNITRIKYTESTRFEPILSTIDWAPWKTVTHLEIDYDYTWTDPVEDILFKLSAMHSLVHLIFDTSSAHMDDLKGLHLSWGDMEQLHGHFPRLEYLETNCLLTPMSYRVLERVLELPPASNIKHVRFDNDAVSTPWMFYFACKYPNLETMRFVEGDREPEDVERDFQSKYYQDDLLILSTLDRFFPCLKTAHIFTESWNGWPFSLFTKSLKHFGVKLEFLVYNLNIYSADWLALSNECLEHVASSIRIMYIKWGENMIDKRITDDFVSCPSLIELHLYTRSQFEIDVILDKCPELRIFDIDIDGSDEVMISENAQAIYNDTPSIHPLRKLTVKSSFIQTELFKYISF